jgi:hypothetical protein
VIVEPGMGSLLNGSVTVCCGKSVLKSMSGMNVSTREQTLSQSQGCCLDGLLRQIGLGFDGVWASVVTPFISVGLVSSPHPLSWSPFSMHKRAACSAASCRPTTRINSASALSMVGWPAPTRVRLASLPHAIIACVYCADQSC